MKSQNRISSRVTTSRSIRPETSTVPPPGSGTVAAISTSARKPAAKSGAQAGSSSTPRALRTSAVRSGKVKLGAWPARKRSGWGGRRQQDRGSVGESKRAFALNRVAQLWRAHRRKTRVFDEALQILAIGRHPINRVSFFSRCAAQKKNVVAVDPAAIPAEKLLRSKSDCALRIEIKRP